MCTREIEMTWVFWYIFIVMVRYKMSLSSWVWMQYPPAMLSTDQIGRALRFLDVDVEYVSMHTILQRMQSETCPSIFYYSLVKFWTSSTQTHSHNAKRLLMLPAYILARAQPEANAHFLTLLTCILNSGEKSDAVKSRYGMTMLLLPNDIYR